MLSIKQRKRYQFQREKFFDEMLKFMSSTSSQEKFLHSKHSFPLQRLSMRNMNLKDQPTEKVMFSCKINQLETVNSQTNR